MSSFPWLLHQNQDCEIGGEEKERGKKLREGDQGESEYDVQSSDNKMEGKMDCIN